MDSHKPVPEEAVSETAAPSSLWPPVLILAILSTIFVMPLGDFPLNDDWIYAAQAHRLVSEGRLEGHPFAMARNPAQTLWGGAFVLAFGESFTVLRVSTLILAVLAVWAVARAARACGLSRGGALFCAFVVWSNPIFMNLAYTFMTDVPFLAPMALSIFFYLNALRHKRATDIFLGTACCAVAVFVRHFGILPAVAFAVVSFAGWVIQWRRPDPWGAAAFLVPLAVAAALWAYWVSTSTMQFTWHAPDLAEPLLLRAAGVVRYAVIAAFYMGLFLMPMAAVKGMALLRHGDRWAWPQLLGLASLAGFGVLWVHGIGTWHFPTFPILPNILRDFGTGPLTLTDTTMLAPGWSPVRAGALALGVVSYLSVVSVAILLADLAVQFTSGDERRGPAAERFARGQGLFLAVCALLLFGAAYNPWLPVTYDRYLLPGMVPLCLLCAMGIDRQRRGRGAGLVVCCLFFGVSLCCVQDYLSWNRARWVALDALRAREEIPASDIDGGYEFNGMYTSEEFMRRHRTTDFRERGERGWWVLDDTYAVSFLPREDYDVVARVTYFSCLARRSRPLLVLRRAGFRERPGRHPRRGTGRSPLIAFAPALE
jgi:Dolichyl-phosphate-mannose-protein mannosyltransferase